MRRLALVTLAACTLRPYDFDASATNTDGTTASTTAPDPTTAPDSTTAAPTTTTTGATSASTGTTGAPFIDPPDGGVASEECRVWEEDCPPGDKCMPYSGDGDNVWESLKCVPIVPDPDQVGEPCVAFGSGVSGEDSCDLHMMCWDVDPDTGVGTCIAMCGGSPDDPICADPATACVITNDGVLILCLDVGCDPLAQDCPGGDICIPDPMHADRFVCFIDGREDGQLFDACAYANACDPGLLCTDPALAAECDPMAPGCCLPWCDLSQIPPPCPGAGQQCLPWYDEGQSPPGLENVGVCGLPQ